METETEVKVFLVNLKCPDCEIIMERGNSMDQNIHQDIKYECSRCNYCFISGKLYPYRKYIPK